MNFSTKNLKKRLKNLKGFSINVITDPSELAAKQYRMTTKKAVSYVLIYSFIVAFIGFLFFSFTPVQNIFFPSQSNLSSSDLEMVNELNKKMNFLTRELENLKSTNERLRYAIMLGDSTLLDSLKYDKKKNGGSNKLKIEGSIFSVITKIFFSDSTKDNELKSYYFYNPVNGFVSREFKPENAHMGIDYVVKSGTPVYASASGYIIFSDYTVSSGYMIIISHPDNFITVYKHCSVLLKKERENVLQGEIIALSGNTGEITTGPHLHFEIWSGGKPVDPKNFLINY
ncbi:MAG: M23 family metallopeptidase [Ignavibacteriaceae bacterium]